mmetsp:Transcript_37082/g.122907  ORF Transcript_37082/g.122907 Transcript_37082/m.122907 type:complete len:279 (-) Transcript_37082:1329-2165(-)
MSGWCIRPGARCRFVLSLLPSWRLGRLPCHAATRLVGGRLHLTLRLLDARSGRQRVRWIRQRHGRWLCGRGAGQALWRFHLRYLWLWQHHLQQRVVQQLRFPVRVLLRLAALLNFLGIGREVVTIDDPPALLNNRVVDCLRNPTEEAALLCQRLLCALRNHGPPILLWAAGVATPPAIVDQQGQCAGCKPHRPTHPPGAVCGWLQGRRWQEWWRCIWRPPRPWRWRWVRRRRRWRRRNGWSRWRQPRRARPGGSTRAACLDWLACHYWCPDTDEHPLG